MSPLMICTPNLCVHNRAVSYSVKGGGRVVSIILKFTRASAEEKTQSGVLDREPREQFASPGYFEVSC